MPLLVLGRRAEESDPDDFRAYDCECGQRLLAVTDAGLLAQLRTHWPRRHGVSLAEPDARRLVGGRAFDLFRTDPSAL